MSSNVPIPPQTGQVAAKAVKTTAGKLGTPARVALSLAAIAGGYKLVEDTWSGTRMKRQDAIDEVKEHAEWTDMRYGMGHWSGNPWMDEKAHSFKRWTLFGPGNFFIKWKTSQIKLNSWINDVIIPNLLPISMMVGGAIGLIGFKNLKGGGKATQSLLRNIKVPSSFKSGMKQVAGKTGQGVGKGLGKLISIPFKSPVHLGVTAIGMIFGSYALSRFQASYGHDGQHAYFRKLTNEKEVVEEE